MSANLAASVQRRIRCCTYDANALRRGDAQERSEGSNGNARDRERPLVVNFGPRPSRGLVLVAEGNDAMRTAIGAVLEAAGYASLLYANARELIAGARAEDAMCVVSDIRLPGMSGFQLLARLRKGTTEPLVILISAHDSLALRNKAMRLGVAGYLAKPFEGTALVSEIDRLAEAARARRY